MTTAMSTELELLRTRVSGAVGRQMPEHIGRLGWDAGRLAAYQRNRLRALLARAIAGSPFHARRLRGVDPDRFELADLARLPVMTKAEMMENFAGDFDQSAVTAIVGQSLHLAGLARPQVGFRRVGALDRDPMTRKARRFIPLSARIP
jgi:hypothetical protein